MTHSIGSTLCQRELDPLRGWPVSAVVIEATWGAIQLGQWRSKLSAKQIMASFCSWVAQGHRLVLAGVAEKASEIAKGILFYAARYRLREAGELLKAIDNRKGIRMMRNVGTSFGLEFGKGIAMISEGSNNVPK